MNDRFWTRAIVSSSSNLDISLEGRIGFVACCWYSSLGCFEYAPYSRPTVLKLFSLSNMLLRVRVKVIFGFAVGVMICIDSHSFFFLPLGFFKFGRFFTSLLPGGSLFVLLSVFFFSQLSFREIRNDLNSSRIMIASFLVVRLLFRAKDKVSLLFFCSAERRNGDTYQIVPHFAYSCTKSHSQTE